MKLSQWISFVFITLSFISNISFADTKDQNTFIDNLASSGITYTSSGQNLDIVIDEVKALNTIPKLQELGYLSKKINQDVVNAKPTEISFTIGTMFTTVLLYNYYSNHSDADQLYVNAYMLTPDKDGSFSKQLCYSFGFNRNLYKTTNWNTYNEKDLVRNAPNFTIAPWCHDQMADELKHNI